MSTAVRSVAFYLPQFHITAENDEWWGPGFTEWTNAKRARPLFPRHYQPHEAGELGYYDLLSADARQAQAELAAEYLVDAFCYYHYWFEGRRQLNRPLDAMLNAEQPAFPFCLCWANEPWTRSWDGRSGEVLVGQTYSADDDRRHIEWLLPVFEDPRYMRMDGRPIFLVYRASQLPEPARTMEGWRAAAQHAGIGDLYLCRVESFRSEHSDPRPLGFDAAVEFQPDWTRAASLPARLRARLGQTTGLGKPPFTKTRYGEMIDRMLKKPAPVYTRHPCVSPGWDNTPRRLVDAFIIDESTPDLYERWLRDVLARDQSRLIFVNAWNEWGEGCHLEPDARWGRAFLEAHRRAMLGRRETREAGAAGEWS